MIKKFYKTFRTWFLVLAFKGSKFFAEQHLMVPELSNYATLGNFPTDKINNFTTKSICFY